MSKSSYGAETFRRERNARTGEQFSAIALVDDLQNQRAVGGRNAEILQHIARATGQSFDPGRPTIPLALLLDPSIHPDELARQAQRDMTAAGVQGSGYLVGETDAGLGALERLRGFSITAAAGVNLLSLPDGSGNIALPLVTSPVGWTWLTDENAAGVDDQPVIGLTSGTPKQAIGLVKFSGMMLRQSNAENVVRDHLLRGFGETLDAAIINGSSVAGEPTGLLNIPTINTQSGAAITSDTITDMEQDSVDAGATSYGWVTDAASATVLKKRATVAGDRTIWRGPLAAGNILDVPAFSSLDMPAATAIVGPWSSIYIPIWGGVTVGIDPYFGFTSGIVAMRLLVSLDVIVGHPAGFSAATSLS